MRANLSPIFGTSLAHYLRLFETLGDSWRGQNGVKMASGQNGAITLRIHQIEAFNNAFTHFNCRKSRHFFYSFEA